MCPSSVRYIFLRNHLTDFDETLHALCTLPDDVKNAKKISISQKKKFRFSDFFSDFFRTHLFWSFRSISPNPISSHKNRENFVKKSQKRNHTKNRENFAKGLPFDDTLYCLRSLHSLTMSKTRKKSIFAKNYHTNFAIFS